jgi:hypothetical protein
MGYFLRKNAQVKRRNERKNQKQSTLNSFLKFCISTETKVMVIKIRRKCNVSLYCKLSGLEFNEKVQLKGM